MAKKYNEELVEQLKPRQRAVVKLRYGHHLVGEEIGTVNEDRRELAVLEGRPRSLSEVAVFFGVSRERVRQIEERAFIVMRKFGKAMKV